MAILTRMSCSPSFFLFPVAMTAPQHPNLKPGSLDCGLYPGGGWRGPGELSFEEAQQLLQMQGCSLSQLFIFKGEEGLSPGPRVPC